MSGVLNKKIMKILNLYAGIGGNRKLWDKPLKQKFGNDYQITAIEYNEEIASIYKEFFPDDNVIVTDGHQYLLEHFNEFDFIWSSISCITHSNARFWASKGNICDIKYPDLKLYEEILLLRYYFEGLFIVENVNPYYTPLINPDYIIDRHLFWTNIKITQNKFEKEIGINNQGTKRRFGFDISKYKIKHRKDQILRNLVNPEIGLHFLNRALEIKESQNLEQMRLFE